MGSRRVLAFVVAVALLGACGATTSAATSSAGPAVPLFTMHVRMSLSYRVVGNVTRIRGIALAGLPPGWHVIVRCLGEDCFSPGLHHTFGKDLRILRSRKFYAGQRLVFIFRRVAFKSVTFVLKMRYNNDPRLTLFKPRHKAQEGAGVGLSHPR